MQEPKHIKQKIYIKLVNNTSAPQGVVLFDAAGAYNSSNAIIPGTSFGWDITAELAASVANNLTVLYILAAPVTTGIYQLYSYTNPSGVFTSASQVVNGLNSFGIGIFSAAGNVVSVISNAYRYAALQISNPNVAIHQGIGTSSSLGSFVFDPGYTPALVGTSTQISALVPFWINTGASLVAGPYNRASIGIGGVSPVKPDATGFFINLNSAVAKTVYFGLSSAGIQVFVNGVLIVDAAVSTSEWYIIPVDLVAGNNIIQLFAVNPLLNYFNNLGLEIYDNTAVELLASTGYGSLNLLFSSISLIGQDLI